MRTCARVVDDQYCGRSFDTSRRITVTTSAVARADLEYVVDLCLEHGIEYDRDHL